MGAIESFRAAHERVAIESGLVAREAREACGSLVVTPALTAALAHDAGCLLLLGDPGTGKSLAAARWLLAPSCSLTRWQCVITSKAGGRWEFGGYGRGAARWRTAKSLSRVQQYDQGAIDDLITPSRLVLDDLGTEYLDKGGFLLSLIDEIISERHRRDLPTVLTTNNTAAEFAQRYGGRVVDRIRGSGAIVVCDGKSLRGARIRGADVPPSPTDEELLAVAEREQDDYDARTRESAEYMAKRAADRAALTHPQPRAPVKFTPEELAARKAEIQSQLAAEQRGVGVDLRGIDAVEIQAFHDQGGQFVLRRSLFRHARFRTSSALPPPGGSGGGV